VKIFKITPGSVTQMIPADIPDELKIGSSGRGRHQEIVPIMGTGSSFGVKITSAGVLIVRGEFEDNGRCIAIINSSGGYSKGRSYTIPNVDGMKKISQGNHANGIAGRAGNSEVALVICSPGVEFRLLSKYDESWFSWGGRAWKIEGPQERKARLAIAALERGEGEWL